MLELNINNLFIFLPKKGRQHQSGGDRGVAEWGVRFWFCERAEWSVEGTANSAVDKTVGVELCPLSSTAVRTDSSFHSPVRDLLYIPLVHPVGNQGSFE